MNVCSASFSQSTEHTIPDLHPELLSGSLEGQELQWPCRSRWQLPVFSWQGFSEERGERLLCLDKRTAFYLGTKSWWIFLVMGIIGCIASILCNDITISALLGVFSFSSFWSIKEVFEQRKRVEKGWFPENPNRKK